jgi:hypothetical protein
MDSFIDRVKVFQSQYDIWQRANVNLAARV